MFQLHSIDVAPASNTTEVCLGLAQDIHTSPCKEYSLPNQLRPVHSCTILCADRAQLGKQHSAVQCMFPAGCHIGLQSSGKTPTQTCWTCRSRTKCSGLEAFLQRNVFTKLAQKCAGTLVGSSIQNSVSAFAVLSACTVDNVLENRPQRRWMQTINTVIYHSQQRNIYSEVTNCQNEQGPSQTG